MHTLKHTYTPTVPEGLLVSQHSRPSLRHVSAASQFCLFKDQAVLLGKWFWRRARSTRISKSLVSHQNRCNFIFASSSSSIKPGSLSLWPASLHSNNSAKWDRAHELCCFSPTFCVALSDSPWVQITGWPAVLSLTYTVQYRHTTKTLRKEGSKEGRKEGMKEGKKGGREEEKKERKRTRGASISSCCHPNIKYWYPYYTITSPALNRAVISFIMGIWAAAQRHWLIVRVGKETSEQGQRF